MCVTKPTHTSMYSEARFYDDARFVDVIYLDFWRDALKGM